MMMASAASAWAAPGDTTLVSRADTSTGVKGDDESFVPSISADGRYVAFASYASNLDADDPDDTADVFVRDLQTGTTTLVSRADTASGVKGDEESFDPSISADGRYVAFESFASNLDGDDIDFLSDVFVRDLQTDTTTLVSRADTATGAKGDEESFAPSISADGRFVAFESFASNLDGDDSDFLSDVFVRDLQTDATTLVSRADTATGVKGNDESFSSSISADGRVVAFSSVASNLDGDDADTTADVFVRDLQDSATTLVSRADTATGVKGNGGSFGPSISADGRVVAFDSAASNLDGADTDALNDVFVRGLQDSATTLVSRADTATGAKGSEESFEPSISADGRFVAFESYASNLDGDDTDTIDDVFLRDLQDSTTTLVSRADTATGVKGNDGSFEPSVSADARVIAFESAASNLDPDDTDDLSDVFVRERVNGSPSIVTDASDGVPIGGQVFDTATLSGGFQPSGTVTFRLYGPTDPMCLGTPVFTSTTAVVGATATSGSFTPTSPGIYRWIATYNGDANNNSAAGACNDANESVTVAKRSPAISTNASAGVPVGGSVTDTATLSGAFNVTGSVTFALYGPDNASCAGMPVSSTTKAIGSDGTVTSDRVTPPSAGTYRWIANYNGDANNNAVAGACNDANETVVIAKRSPTISTNASAGVPVGGQVTDSATLGGEFNPTNGTVTFRLYGPDNANCTGMPVSETTKAIGSDGTVTSDPVTPAAGGLYRWIATYNGDANNSSVAGQCNDPNESVRVNSPPAAVDDAYSVIGGAELSVTEPGVLGNDTDADNDPLTAQLVDGPSEGTLDLDEDGSFTYTPGEDTIGPVTFTYRASDGTATSNVATVTITVEAGCGGQRATIVGTAGKDTLKGSQARDVIVGLGGDDRIDTGSSNDVICGGSGADTLIGGSDDDRLFGGSGDDRLDAGSGEDALVGGDGVDRLLGGSDRDTLDGGAGTPDRCDGEGDNDTTTGGCEQTISIP